MAAFNPPFRADHVGGWLRPQRLEDARARFFRNEIDRAALRTVEDEAIRELVAKQEAVGLRAVSEASPAAPPARRRSPSLRPPWCTLAVVGSIDIHAYPEVAEFFHDLAQVYRDEIRSLYAAGCRYIQLDDTNLAYLCDPQLRAQAQERGDDPNELPYAYASLMNAAIDRRPKDLTVALHLCRGNVKGVAVAEAGYEPVADTLFNELNVDAYFLEFDDPRSEDFVPLRFVPKNKTVVLGLGSSKVAAPDSAEQIVERIKAAAKYMPLENLCLSPQCGFASTMHGNELTDAEQWARVGMIVKITEEVWGEAAV